MNGQEAPKSADAETRRRTVGRIRNYLRQMSLAREFRMYNLTCRKAAEEMEAAGIKPVDIAAEFLNSDPAAAMDVMAMLAMLRAWRATPVAQLQDFKREAATLREAGSISITARFAANDQAHGLRTQAAAAKRRRHESRPLPLLILGVGGDYAHEINGEDI